jgi:hypothetical protein
MLKDCSIEVGPVAPPIDTEQCRADFDSALAPCSAATISPGSSCCVGMQALGVPCLSLVKNNAAGNGTLSLVLGAVLSGCQIELDGTAPSSAPSSAPGPGASPLPAGNTTLSWRSSGDSTACRTYDDTVDAWVNETSPVFWGKWGCDVVGR